MSARHSPRAEAGNTSARAPRGTVLFVHGLWMTGAESFLLRRRLAREGWALRVFPYSSVGEPIDAVARRCARYARFIAARTFAPVHLLGHSLGGLVVCRMFEMGLLAADRFSGDFCRVVVLGSPLNGSRSGRAFARLGPAGALLGKCGTELVRCEAPGGGRCRRWTHTAQVGVIAGNRPLGLGRVIAHLSEPNDGTVAVAETELEGATARCVLPVSHLGMLASDEVASRVAAFFDHGSFDVAGARGQ